MAILVVKSLAKTSLQREKLLIMFLNAVYCRCVKMLLLFSFSAKDKNEKPFAMAFIKLLNKNGTTLKDQEHDLLLYKVNL